MSIKLWKTCQLTQQLENGVAERGCCAAVAQLRAALLHGDVDGALARAALETLVREFGLALRLEVLAAGVASHIAERARGCNGGTERGIVGDDILAGGERLVQTMYFKGMKLL